MNSIKLSGHIDKTRKLMEESPSLLVRGCAAICLAYTGIVDAGIFDLLSYLGAQELDGVSWAWDNTFSDIVRKAWLYSADFETIFDGFPLWFILEKSVFENTPEAAVIALKKVDVWKALPEIYRPYNTNQIEERCTLNLKDYYDDKKTKKREEIIEDILADALAGYGERIKVFLDEWLIKSEELQDYDWKFKALGQRIGICLLSLARSGKHCERFFPLVRPYHPIARFSNFPIPLLKEVLGHTSEDHQIKIKKQFVIK